jgi:hypothetical protein
MANKGRLASRFIEKLKLPADGDSWLKQAPDSARMVQA